ncbi:hypothetical protein L1049_015041 [Liquidambar formosana]|uniref:Uncharacterized protein n=1 Tax=Liquidambar formosana TaxID=63359 RepID=A0AAP0RXB5_LIQFO
MRDNDYGDDEDENLMEVDPIVAFANPVQRKQKKDMDFSRWREMNIEPHFSSHASQNKTREGMKRDLGAGFAGSVADMEIDNLDKLPLLMDVKDVSSSNFKGELLSMSGNGQIDAEGISRDPITKAQAEEMEKMDPALSEVLMQKLRTSTSATSSRSDNFGNEQGSMTLESQIDAENRAQLQRMSPDEIAQAQAEIMEKMDPQLLKVLQKRGQDKLKKQKSFGSDLTTNGEMGNLRKENQLAQDAKGSTLFESDISHMVTNATSKDTLRGLGNGTAQNMGPANSTLWKVWSERVEAIRELRFSLDGTVIDNDNVQVPENGEMSIHSSYSAENVTERDFLRTEGDPGAVGYTIKEALALTRSVVPGQRALALYLLSSVLDKALHNILQNQVGRTMNNADTVDSFIDWEAVWAFALGPEPELVLSLRMSLDDNHNSVVLASAKVIQCVLSCDVNENFFDLSEKIATYGKDIYTAPIFRSRPEVDVGFLHGGFWKYNAKPSNILPFGEDIVDEKTDGEHTIQDDIVVSGQDIAAGFG